MTATRRAAYKQHDEQEDIHSNGQALAETLILDEQEQEDLVTTLKEQSTSSAARASRGVDVLVIVSMLFSAMQAARSSSLGGRLAQILLLPAHLLMFSDETIDQLSRRFSPNDIDHRRDARSPQLRNIARMALVLTAMPLLFALFWKGAAADIATLGSAAPVLVVIMRELVDRDARDVQAKVEELRKLQYKLKGA